MPDLLFTVPQFSWEFAVEPVGDDTKVVVLILLQLPKIFFGECFLVVVVGTKQYVLHVAKELFLTFETCMRLL